MLRNPTDNHLINARDERFYAYVYLLGVSPHLRVGKNTDRVWGAPQVKGGRRNGIKIQQQMHT